MQKIIVFDANGRTGKEVFTQSLEKGYEVTAIIRHPSVNKMQHQNFKIIKGDILEPSTFETKFQQIM